jgi:hypothetical protein
VEIALQEKQRRLTAASGADNKQTMGDIQTGQRSQLEARYVAKTNHPKPPMDQQGSDHYMGLQYKSCTKGEIGYFTNKQIVSYLPEAGETQQRKKRRTDPDGVVHEYEEEERQDPITLEQWRRQMLVFRNTLLMCTWAFPQFAHFDLTKETLDDFYDFLMGPAIATRTPAPSLAVIMISERKAWREIVLKMHKGDTLKSALQAIKSDSLFWAREVYERIHPAASGADNKWNKENNYPNTPPSRGTRGGIKRNNSWTPPQQQWNHPPSPKGQGKGAKSYSGTPWVPPPPPPQKGGKAMKGGKGKGKGKSAKGKSGHSSWPAEYATKDPKGKDYCRDHTITRQCSGNCGRSHQCPVLKPDGQPCNGNHAASSCSYN